LTISARFLAPSYTPFICLKETLYYAVYISFLGEERGKTQEKNHTRKKKSKDLKREKN